MVNTNSEVKILRGLFGKGTSKYSGLSSGEQMYTAIQDVIGATGNTIDEVKLSDRTTGILKYARARVTYNLMATKKLLKHTKM